MRYFLTIANGGNEKLDFAYGYISETVDQCKEIVQEVAKEYGKDTNVPSNGWIPVTENPPAKNRFYIVTTYDGEIYRAEPAYYARFGYLGQQNIKPQWWSDHSSNACLIEDDDYEFVAWMELPAPYQKGE